MESGKANDRPELAKALVHCKLTGATLIVAKLDRLCRDQAFLMSVWTGTGDGGVVFCDLPSIPAGPVGKFILQQMASVAELERGLISQRTKAALAAAKERGVKLGGFKGYIPDARPAPWATCRRRRRSPSASARLSGTCGAGGYRCARWPSR